MQAIVQDQYGSAPEKVLRLAEVAQPKVSDGAALVRVRAASVDRGTWHSMAGLPYPIRVAGFGVRRPKAINPGQGRLVIVGGETSGRLLGGSGRQIRATLVSLFVSQKLGTFIASENAQDLAALRQLIEAGRVTPAVGATYPLAETATAIRVVIDGAARGKVVIAI